MELSWSTFILEVINFLILLWILKRFLYQPVLDVIARRRAGIEKTLADATRLNAEATALREQYEGRLADAASERQHARAALESEIEALRREKLAALDQELERARQKAAVIETRRRSDAQDRVEHAAFEQAAKFASVLLREAAGPETEQRLIDIVLADLAALPETQVAAIRSGQGAPDATISVQSAFALDVERQAALEQALRVLGGDAASVRFAVEPALLAGLNIGIGAWQLAANLRDELKGFSELRHEA